MVKGPVRATQKINKESPKRTHPTTDCPLTSGLAAALLSRHVLFHS